MFPATPLSEHSGGLEPAGSGSRLLLASPDAPRDGARPLLSIAIPTFRRFDLLAEALSSVFALRFNVPVEVLVVDNDPGNDPIALEAMKAFAGRGLSYYKNESNLGMFGNWNRCLELATGRYVTILHDDDLLDAEFAQQVNERLTSAWPGVAALAWRHRLLDQRQQSPDMQHKTPLRRLQGLIAFLHREVSSQSAIHLFLGNPFAGTLGVVFDRDKALALGGFDAAWHPISDYEFWCRWVVAYGAIPLFRLSVGQYRMRQNESLRAEVREAFLSGSLRLRRRMLEHGDVPCLYRLVLPAVQEHQRLSLSEQWRSAGDKPLSWPSSLMVISWRAVAWCLKRPGAWLRPRSTKGSAGHGSGCGRGGRTG